MSIINERWPNWRQTRGLSRKESGNHPPRSFVKRFSLLKSRGRGTVSGSEQSLPPRINSDTARPCPPYTARYTHALSRNSVARCRRLELSARDNGTALSLVTLPRLLFALHVYVGHSLFAHPAVSILLFLVWLCLLCFLASAPLRFFTIELPEIGGSFLKRSFRLFLRLLFVLE